MKRLLYLLPLYILLLSGIPCKADDGCCAEETNAAAGQHRDQLPDEKPTLPCSPFFACGACHGFIIPETTVPLLPPVFYPRRHTPLVAAHYLGDFSATAWQPPRQG